MSNYGFKMERDLKPKGRARYHIWYHPSFSRDNPICDLPKIKSARPQGPMFPGWSGEDDERGSSSPLSTITTTPWPAGDEFEGADDREEDEEDEEEKDGQDGEGEKEESTTATARARASVTHRHSTDAALDPSDPDGGVDRVRLLFPFNPAEIIRRGLEVVNRRRRPESGGITSDGREDCHGSVSDVGVGGSGGGATGSDGGGDGEGCGDKGGDGGGDDGGGGSSGDNGHGGAGVGNAILCEGGSDHGGNEVVNCDVELDMDTNMGENFTDQDDSGKRNNNADDDNIKNNNDGQNERNDSGGDDGNRHGRGLSILARLKRNRAMPASVVVKTGAPFTARRKTDRGTLVVAASLLSPRTASGSTSTDATGSFSPSSSSSSSSASSSASSSSTSSTSLPFSVPPPRPQVRIYSRKDWPLNSPTRRQSLVFPSANELQATPPRLQTAAASSAATERNSHRSVRSEAVTSVS